MLFQIFAPRENITLPQLADFQLALGLNGTLPKEAL